MSITPAQVKEGVDSRFLLPVRRFDFIVEFVEIVPGEEQVRRLANLLDRAVVESLKGRPDCPMYALRHRTQQSRKNEEQPRLHGITLDAPVYDFGVVLDTDSLSLVKLNSSLEDLILTVPIFEDICTRLFSPTASGHDEHPDRLTDLLGLGGGVGLIHRVLFTFDQRMRLGTHMTDSMRQARNTELLNRLLRTAAAGGDEPHTAPLGVLRPETIWRGDVTLAFSAALGKEERKRSVWIEYKGPYNVTQRDVNLEFQYRCGVGDAHFEERDLLDWETPFLAFYRDIVLKKFMPAFFHDVNVVGEAGD